MQPTVSELVGAYNLSAAVALAGPLQERLSAPRADGQWRRHLASQVEGTALHEAGHVIVGFAFGLRVSRVSVDRRGKLSGYVAFESANPSNTEERIAALEAAPSISETRIACRDFVKGLRLAQPNITFRGARKAWREFCTSVEELLVRHHRDVNILAAELVRSGTLVGADVEAVLG